MRQRTAIFLLSALAGAAGAQEVKLPDDLSIGWTDSPDAFAQMSYCLPEITQEKVREIQSTAAKRVTALYARASERTPYLLVMGDKFSCISRNGNGKPILPARIFGKIVRFEGASEQTTASLYRSFATQLATRGAAEALVKMDNGNAMEITMSVTEDAPTEISYTTNFLKAGQFDETKYRFAISDQIKAVSTMSYGPSGRRSVAILQDEIAPRPMKGENLLVQGNRHTAEYAFGGSTWRFNTGGTISLANGGSLTMTPKAGEAKSGSWRVEDGALYFNYGTIYGSATLDLENRLQVEFRNTSAQAGKNERRWNASLEKSLF